MSDIYDKAFFAKIAKHFYKVKKAKHFYKVA